MPLPRLVLIAAVCRNNVLASHGKIPWHLPRDVAHFRARTANRPLLLGRTTYEQMIGWFKPGQTPLVLTRKIGYAVPDGHTVASVAEALQWAAAQGVEELMVCGGGQIYRESLPYADEIILTRVEASLEGDVFFPALPAGEWIVVHEERFAADADNNLPVTICRILPRHREGKG